MNVTFTVTEGAAARIRDLRIVGSKAFSESTLLGLFDLNDGGWLNWYTKADRYSRAKLNADLETLRAYYLNRGYLEFNIESTQVAISPDKQNISITINVKEGQPYTVTAVKLEGEYLGKEEDFKTLVTIRPGEPYRAEAVADTTREFIERFGAFGYAFARVDARPDIDRATGRVVVNLVADPATPRLCAAHRRLGQHQDTRRSRAARVPPVRVVVVRRHQDQAVARPGRPAGLLQGRGGRLRRGAGFAGPGRPDDGGDGKADRQPARRRRVLDSGQALVQCLDPAGERVRLGQLPRHRVQHQQVQPQPRLELDRSLTSRSNGISRAFDIYYRTSKPLNSQGEEYELITPGVSVRFGVPFSEFDTVFFGVGFERTEIKGDTALPNNYFLFRENFGATTSSVPVTIGLVTRRPRQRDRADLGKLPAQ